MKKSLLESYQKAIQAQVAASIGGQKESPIVDEIGFLEYNVSAPIEPEQAIWEILPNPERYYRDYEFDSFKQISEFLEMCFSVHDEISQTVYINYRIQKIGRIGVLSVEIGEGVLVEEEAIATQIFDQIYEIILNPEKKSQVPTHIIYDEEQDFEFEEESYDYYE